MTKKNALAGVAVGNLDEAIGWYSKLIGRGPDRRPLPTDAEYEFGDGGWMQLFSDAEHAGQSSITFTVDDIDSAIDALNATGIEFHGPRRNSDAIVVRDPDGNRIVFASAKPGLARSLS